MIGPASGQAAVPPHLHVSIALIGPTAGAGRLDWAVPAVFARDPREPLR